MSRLSGMLMWRCVDISCGHRISHLVVVYCCSSSGFGGPSNCPMLLLHITCSG